MRRVSATSSAAIGDDGGGRTASARSSRGFQEMGVEGCCRACRWESDGRPLGHINGSDGGRDVNALVPLSTAVEEAEAGGHMTTAEPWLLSNQEITP